MEASVGYSQVDLGFYLESLYALTMEDRASSLTFLRLNCVYVCVCVCMCAHMLSRVQLFAAPCTVAGKFLCPWNFPARILEWLPFLTPGDLPDPGIEPSSLTSPTLAGRLFQ